MSMPSGLRMNRSSAATTTVPGVQKKTGVPQQIYNPQQARVAISGSPMDSGAANLFSNLSQSFSNAADQQFKMWQQAEIKRASEAGELEGTQGKPQFKEGDHLTAQAYNESAKLTYGNKLMAETDDKLSQLANDYKADPESFTKLASKYVDELTYELAGNSNTAQIAAAVKNKAALRTQALNRSITNNFQALQKDKMQADTEDTLDKVKADSYRYAGNVFSKDPNEQLDTLEQFSLAKQQHDAMLHQVLPDGTPVYSPSQIAARQKAFHQTFWARAAQARINSGDLSDDDIAAIMDGTWEVNVAGMGKVSIIENVGADYYDKLIKDPMIRKLQEDETKEKQAQKDAKEAHEQNQEKYGHNVWTRAMQGDKEVTVNWVHDEVMAGRISPSDGEKITKVIMNGSGDSDNPAFKADMEYRIAQGEDIRPYLAANPDAVKKDTMFELLEKNEKGLDSQEKEIFNMSVKKDKEGYVIQGTVEKGNDYVDRYRYLREHGGKDGTPLSHGQAREIVMREMRESQDTYRQVDRIPLFGKPNNDGLYDITQSYNELKAAYKRGELSLDELEIELEKLETIRREQNKIIGEAEAKEQEKDDRGWFARTFGGDRVGQ